MNFKVSIYKLFLAMSLFFIINLVHAQFIVLKASPSHHKEIKCIPLGNGFNIYELNGTFNSNSSNKNLQITSFSNNSIESIKNTEIGLIILSLYSSSENVFNLKINDQNDLSFPIWGHYIDCYDFSLPASYLLSNYLFSSDASFAIIQCLEDDIKLCDLRTLDSIRNISSHDQGLDFDPNLFNKDIESIYSRVSYFLSENQKQYLEENKNDCKNLFTLSYYDPLIKKIEFKKAIINYARVKKLNIDQLENFNIVQIFISFNDCYIKQAQKVINLELVGRTSTPQLIKLLGSDRDVEILEDINPDSIHEKVFSYNHGIIGLGIDNEGKYQYWFFEFAQGDTLNDFAKIAFDNNEN